MDRRMAAHCSSSSSRPTPSASRDNNEALMSDANNLIKKGNDEKERVDDGRRRSRDRKDENRQSKEKELEKKVNLSQGDRIFPHKKSFTPKSGQPPEHVSREKPGAESSSRVTFHAIDPEWMATMNKRYGLEGEEAPFNVVEETKRETSPPRQPKRADETPPPTPPKPAPPLPKLQSAVKPHSDPYENEEEDPATAALRREIRTRDAELRAWIGENLNESLFLTLLQDKMEKRKKMVNRLEELKKSPMTPQKEEYVPRFEARSNASLQFGPTSSDRKKRGNDRSRSNKSTDNSSRKSHNPNREEVGSRGQKCSGRGKRAVDVDGGGDTVGSGIDWKRLKLENEKKREVDRASQMDARNRLAALAGGYVTATGEAVDLPPEPNEASTSSGFGGRPLNPERSLSGRGSRRERFEETEIVELDSDDDDDYAGEAQRNLSNEDLLAHGIRVVEPGPRKVDPFNKDSPETIVLSDEQEDEWEEMRDEEENPENEDVDGTKDGDENDPAILSLDAGSIEEELNNS